MSVPTNPDALVLVDWVLVEQRLPVVVGRSRDPVPATHATTFVVMDVAARAVRVPREFTDCLAKLMNTVLATPLLAERHDVGKVWLDVPAVNERSPRCVERLLSHGDARRDGLAPRAAPASPELSELFVARRASSAAAVVQWP